MPTEKETLPDHDNGLKVSVIVPIYNMEQYLEECIGSILDQTYDGYEVILVDDGSLDASYEIARKLAKEDPRITVIHKENEGVSIARNTGMQAAGGKWIMFVDPDDRLEPSLIEQLLSFTKDEVDIVACCCNVIFEGKEQEDFFFSSDRIFSDGEEKKELFKQLMHMPYGQPGEAFTGIGVPWGKLYRMSFLRKNNIEFNPDLRRFQDNIFNMYAFFYARSIVYVNLPLYDYRAERIVQYKQNYKPGFGEYISNLCKERYNCLKKLGLFDDDELREFFREEMRFRIIKILHEDTLSQYNKEPFRRKVERTSKLCEMECFEPLIQGPREGFSRRQRLQLNLMKNGRYRILCMLVSMSRR